MVTKKKKPAAKKKAKKILAIPRGYPTLTPGFGHPDANKAVDFLTKAFGAKVKAKYTGPDGAIAHCEMKIGDSLVMFGPPMDGKPYTMRAMIYVKDVDAQTNKAVAAGATIIKAPEDQFHGDRSSRVNDPFGNEWYIATHIEDVSKKEMDRRMALVMSGKPWK